VDCRSSACSRSRRWKPGFYSALISILYAPVRFYLDRFR